MKALVRQAFIDTNQGFSTDRVVADPELNRSFIERCRHEGSTSSPVELNLCLLNLRKAGLLTGLARPTRTAFKDGDSYRHASEIAARFLEKRYATTLDRVICDPTLANEFDSIASEIQPGFSSLEYRWAALNLRKVKSLRPELLSHVVRPTTVSIGSVESIEVHSIPSCQGIYLFYGSSETLYVGEGFNLRKRIAKHLDHSDNKNLARWFWSNGFKNIHLEVQALPDDTLTRVRKALEAELIATRHPVFNVRRLLISE